jgi:hypothetical protein
MKIAWITPFNDRSSISEFSYAISTAMEAECSNGKLVFDIFVSTANHNYSSNHSVFLLEDILKNRDMIHVVFGCYDYVFYNFGNNSENHEYVFTLLNYVPGFVIFHDCVYQHFVAKKIFEIAKSPKIYTYLIAKHHGLAAANFVDFSNITKINTPNRFSPWDTDFCEKIPLIGAVAQHDNIIGAITHSNYTTSFLSKVIKYPICTLRLPGDEKESPSDDQIYKWQQSTLKKDKVTISIIGFIQPAKQIEFIVRTILDNNQIKNKIEKLIICGRPIDSNYVRVIENLVKNENASAIISVEKDVTSDRLQEIKHISDLFINIRFPNTEGGSGSLYEQLGSGRPVITLNSGCFSEVEDGVIKLSKLDSKELAGALNLLISSPEKRIMLGNAARLFNRQYLSCHYVKDLLEFVTNVTSTKKCNNEHLEYLSDLYYYCEYDKEIRNIKPLVELKKNELNIFLQDIFYGFLSNDGVSALIEICASDIHSGYYSYSKLRTLMECVTKIIKGDDPEFWRIDSKHSLDFYYLLSFVECAVLKVFFDFSLQFGITPRFDHHFDDRFSYVGLSSEASMKLKMFGIIKDDYFNYKEGDKGYKKFIEKLTHYNKLEYEQFVYEISRNNSFFCEQAYVNTYRDLAENILSDEDGFGYNHFLNFGISEGRMGKISIIKLLNYCIEEV